MNKFISLAALAIATPALFAIADEGGAGGTVESIAVPANAKLDILTDETKLEALAKVFPSQQVVGSLADALALIEKVAATTDAFYGLPIAMTGLDDAGEPIPEVYEGMRVRLGTLGQRVEVKKGTFKNGVKAITIMPIPTIQQILDNPNGLEFLNKVVGKELGLVTYRNIRDAATSNDLLSGMAKAPRSVEEYLAESKRAGSAGDTETFDAMWKPLRDSVKETLPALHKMLPSKVEVIKCIRSKSYAQEEFPELENAPKGSVFVKLANAVIQNAAENQDAKGAPAPLDSSAISDWLAERETVKLSKRGAQEVDYSAIAEIDFGSFGAAPATETESAPAE